MREELRKGTALSDEELMAQLQQGENEAFSRLLHRYESRIQSYIRRFFREQPLVDDLTQDTFLRVFESRHSYRNVAKFSTWLYTIAGNLARSEYRRRRRRRNQPIHLVGRGGEEFELPLPDTSFCPELGFQQRQHSQRLSAAFDSVSPTFRRVVALRYEEGLAYREIADETELPINTVKSRLHRGRCELREMLGDLK